MAKKKTTTTTKKKGTVSQKSLANLRPNPNIKEVQKLGCSPESRAKAEKTRQLNRSLKREVQESFKELLISEKEVVVHKDDPTYKKFLSKSLKTALTQPNSKNAQYLLSLLIPEGTLQELDNDYEKAINRDKDFIRFRIQKTLFDKQREILMDDKIRYKVIMCSRRAGKTENAKRLLINTCIEPNSPCFYVNLTFKNAINQCYQGCIDLANEIGLIITKSSKTEGFIEFDNGSSITFRGNANKDEQEKMRGYRAKLVIIDESQSQKGLRILIDDIVSPLLMDYTDSVLVLQGTPPRIAKTYFENAFIEAQSTKDSKAKSYSWSMLDNPYIENVEEEIDRICARKRLTRDSSLIQREYLGKIAFDTEAMTFKDYTVYTKDEIDPNFIPTDIAIGCDWGFQDYNSIIALAYSRITKKAFVINEKKFNKSTVSNIIDECRNMYTYCTAFAMERSSDFDLGRIGFYCDTNEESITFELATTYNLPAYNAYKYNKVLATEQLAEACRKGNIKVLEGGILTQEFEQIVYARDEEDNILPTIDDSIFHPDAESALLYASRQYFFDCGEDTGGESQDKKDQKERIANKMSTLPPWLQNQEEGDNLIWS